MLKIALFYIYILVALETLSMYVVSYLNIIVMLGKWQCDQHKHSS